MQIVSRQGTWVFPKIGVPQNGWFIMENPMNKWMIWGENPTIFGNIHLVLFLSFCVIVLQVVVETPWDLDLGCWLILLRCQNWWCKLLGH